MTAQLIEATIRHLYEGQHVRRGAPLSDQVEFRDPLVVVRGERSVAAMFRKLNALFPVTTIERFEAEEDGVLRFSMSVHYRRAEGAKAKVFESTLEVEAVDGAISGITEHWHRPFNRRGDGQGWLSRTLRSGLGRVFS